jgi:DNA-binding CsgD family transcriptional regulator
MPPSTLRDIYLEELTPVRPPRRSAADQPDGWVPLAERLEQAYTDVVRRLPEDARDLVLVAAVDDGGVYDEVAAAASALLGHRELDACVAAATEAGLLEVEDGRLRFLHPLMRSAIEHGASAVRRRRAHAAMATVLEGQDERQAWHRAASLAHPDEAAAVALADAAAAASDRGDMAVAIQALEGAAQLTPDPATRAVRLLRAAELGYALHESVPDGLLEHVGRLPLDAHAQKRLLWLRGAVDKEIGVGAHRVEALVGMAERSVRCRDHELAGNLLLSAALHAFWVDAGPEERERIAHVTDDLAGHVDDDKRLLVLAFGAPLERGQEVLELLGRCSREAAGPAACVVGAFDIAKPLLDAAIDDLRTQGYDGALSRRLSSQAVCAASLGNLRLAGAAAEESERLAAATEQPLIVASAQATHAFVAALRGDTVRACALAGEAEALAAPIGTGALLCATQRARGVAALADGDPAAAFEHLYRVHDPSDPAHHYLTRIYTAAELAEAAARSGRQADARPILDDLDAVSSRLPVPALIASLRYARALLDDDDAEAAFEALLTEDMKRWPFLRARAQLAYGEWLRRRRRPADSRPLLRAARETFEALGTAPWALRARQELRASGETLRDRTPEARDQLTPQELQIAQMAAEGLTNKEIGQRLYLSHRTVSSHLHRIFPKLEITSRTQLVAALRRPGDDPGPAPRLSP